MKCSERGQDENKTLCESDAGCLDYPDHIDLYRLDHIEEVLDLGLDDYLYGGGICVIEWADKGLGTLPRENLLIKMSHLSDVRRGLQFEASGERHTRLLSELRSSLVHSERCSTDRCN